MKRKLIITSIFCIGLLSQTRSQDLSSDLQEVVKSFEAQLEEANKIQIKPTIVTVLPVKKKYLYSVTIVPLDIKYPEPTIKPIATEPDLPFSSYPFYLRAGYGNLKNPKVDLLYYKTDQNKLDYYINAHHYGIDNSLEVKNQKYSESEVGLGAKLRLKENHLVEFNSKFDLKNRNVFFLNFPSEPGNIDLKRRRFAIANDIGLKNINPLSSGLEYKAQFKHSLLNVSNTGVTENKMVLKAEVAKLSDNYTIVFPISASGIQQTQINDLYSAHFTPHLKLNNKKYLFKGGLAISYDNELKTKLWPELLFDYAVSGKYLHAYAAAGQQQTANDLHRISEENPFVNSRMNKLSNSLVQTAALGIRGENVSLAYQGELSYNIHDNFVSYENLDSVTYYFADAAFNKVSYVQLRLSSDFALSNKFTLGGTLIKNFYATDDGVDLYGIHTLELKANATLKLFKDKFALKPMLIIRDRANAVILNPVKIQEEIQLNNQADLSVHGDLMLGRFGLYAEANNILNNKYARWYGYPNVGINFNAGVVLKF